MELELEERQVRRRVGPGAELAQCSERVAVEACSFLGKKKGEACDGVGRLSGKTAFKFRQWFRCGKIGKRRPVGMAEGELAGLLERALLRHVESKAAPAIRVKPGTVLEVDEELFPVWVEAPPFEQHFPLC